MVLNNSTNPPPEQTNYQALKIKEAVRIRDGYRCTVRGMTREDHVNCYGIDLHVHRLIPGSLYSLEGCATVCIPCHGPLPRSPRGSGWSDNKGARRVSIEKTDSQGRRCHVSLSEADVNTVERYRAVCIHYLIRERHFRHKRRHWQRRAEEQLGIELELPFGD